MYMKSYVYVITCLVNQKQYVGKTNDPESRKKGHFHFDLRRKVPRQAIHAAIKKHGVENFVFEVISEHDSEEEAFAEENRLIKQKLSEGTGLYNMNEGGKGGSSPTEETRAKMSASRMGIQYSNETKRKISEAAKKQFSNPENRKLQSERAKNWWKYLPEDEKTAHVERLAAGVRGKTKVISEETKKKIAETLRRNADEKGRAIDRIVELVHNCPDCGQEVKRKGVKGWKCHIKSGPCKPCSSKRAWKTRRAKASPCDSSGPPQQSS